MNGKRKREWIQQRRSAKRGLTHARRSQASTCAPTDAVLADRSLHAHISSYGIVDYYVDQPFSCRNCGLLDIWKAIDQKHYVEISKGHFSARAVRCRACRARERDRIAKARKDSFDGLARKRARTETIVESTAVNSHLQDTILKLNQPVSINDVSMKS
jgi:hypothetical protein